MNFFFQNRVVFAFCPGCEVFGKDVVGGFVMTDFESNPWTAAFLKPNFVDVFFQIFSTFREWLSFFKAGKTGSTIPSVEYEGWIGRL